MLVVFPLFIHKEDRGEHICSPAGMSVEGGAP
jgi:hypothetical protein